jgi:dCTP deaminase
LILSGQSIRRRGIFTPFAERTREHGMTYGVGPAGNDVRVGEELELPPGGFSLASTVEHFEMPNDVLGTVHDKSTWARMGLAAQTTVIEPGWRGHLTLELTNHGRDTLRIKAGSPIAQIILHLLDEPTEAAYSGKYQDQKPGAQAAILEK